MAAFGVPITHEDDAERALRAALEIVPEVEALGLAVRIGVESGEVVVEDAESTFATGEAVNLAARLQQAAQPGEVLLGPGARRLAAGAVEVESAGPLEIRGRRSRSGRGARCACTTRVASPRRRSSAARASWSCSRTRSTRAVRDRRAAARHGLRRARARQDAPRHASSPIRSSA